MAKVIKRGGEGGEEKTALHDIASMRRTPIIERRKAEAKAEAEDIKQRASGEAEQIKEVAASEAQNIKDEAYQKGYEEGRDAGAAELTEVVAKASQRFAELEKQIEPQLRDLALKIARKILGHELEFRPEAVVDIIRQALSEKARQRREIFLRVNPEDMKYVREHKAELLEVLSRAAEIGLREDPDVARHGVIIETDAGMIDAQLETQLAVFEQILKNT